MSQNEYTAENGVTYVAEPENPLSECYGCAHDIDSLAAAKLCSQAEPCQRFERADNRSIIWVVKK